jgi:hypothetical protein
MSVDAELEFPPDSEDEDRVCKAFAFAEDFARFLFEVPPARRQEVVEHFRWVLHEQEVKAAEQASAPEPSPHAEPVP